MNNDIDVRTYFMERKSRTGRSARAREITTAAQLAEIAELTNAGKLETVILGNTAKVYLKLMNDIDLSGYGKNWNGGKGWAPIGQYDSGTSTEYYFKGEFDGGSHTISGLYINNPYVDAQNPGYKNTGLFGYVVGGTVQKTGLINVNITGGDYTGGVAGRVGNGSVENCYTTGAVTGTGNVGGVAGRVGGAVSGSTTIEHGADTTAAVLQALIGYLLPTDWPAHILAALASPFDGGTGADAVNAYQISMPEQLAALAALVNADNAGSPVWADKYYVLTADITLTGEWVPIGHATGLGNTNYFSGHFDGGSHTISGLYINKPNASSHLTGPGYYYTGLFGCVYYGSVANLGIVGASIIGNHYVGGVAGYVFNYGSVENCYVTGTVSGNTNVGGVVGHANGSSAVEVKNCAALNPSVKATTSDAGRVVGEVTSTPTLTANVAFVGMTGSTWTGNAGNHIDGLTKTADELKTLVSPYLLPTDWPAHILVALTTPFSGDGTLGDPYEISTAEQLAALAELVNDDTAGYCEDTVFYRLTADIDLSDYGENFNEELGWIPIGNESNPFVGSFDGYGHVVRNLYINNTDSTSGIGVGLFGTTAICFEIRNLGVVDCNVTGFMNVGGVAGILETGGTITDCYSTATVSGSSMVGGVVGLVKGTVEYCYSTGSVSGDSSGGIAGGFGSGGGSVINCAALNPSVSGDSAVGRVVGQAGTLTNNYAFVDMLGGSSTSDSFSGDNTAPGLGGTDTSKAQAITASFWTGMGFTAVTWKFESDKLPILKAFAVNAQNGDPGIYLTDLPVSDSDGYVPGGSGGASTYSVTFDSRGGSAAAPLSGLAAGAKITKPESPTREGYSFTGWYNEAACETEWDFDKDTVTKSVTLYAGWTAKKHLCDAFTDIKSHWAFDSICYVVENGLFNGTSATAFTPDGSMTRAMFATVLARLDGADLGGYTTSRFSDVPTGEWYSAAIEWAADKGVAEGVGNGKFDPNANITREQMAVMLYNYMKYKGYTMPADAAASFEDEDSISSWAYEAVKAIQKMGVVIGKPGNLYDPQGVATRAEVATIFARFAAAMQ